MINNNQYIPKLLSQAIRKKRGAKSLRIIATEIGISAATLSRIENGKTPNLHSYQRICNWIKQKS